MLLEKRSSRGYSDRRVIGKALKQQDTKYRYTDIESVFQKLISGDLELTEFYHQTVKPNAEDEDERLPYIEIAHFSRFIVEKKKVGKTENFSLFFQNVEEILTHADQSIKELMVVGLFEGIQNIGGIEIDYYRSFDQWLKPNSLKAWRELIDFWEKDDWKMTEEAEKILRGQRYK